MELLFRKGTPEDLELLVDSRLEVLRAANGLPENTPLPEVAVSARSYYRTALADGSHAAFLAFDGETLVATGGVSFYRLLPTVSNPSGREAYLMNLYTRPAYRRRGIAGRMLELLVSEARQQGVASITLEATAMGRPLYERYGFVPMPAEMTLPIPRPYIK